MLPDISVVIPLRNESPNVPQLYRELTDTLEAFGRPYEILLIDDGSTDDTFDVLAGLQATDARLRVIRFRRNFGQTAGFAAGFAHARGRFIVTSDGDLQNDPRDIPAMVEQAERGPDIVAGWRKERKDPFLNRRLPSTIANWLISFATGVKLHDYGCSLKVFRAEVVKPMKLYGEMHRFLPAIASEMGVTIEERVVNHRARMHGTSKYGISRTIRVILDLLTVKFLISYSTRPVQIFGLLGVLMGMLGGIITGYLAWIRLTTPQAIGDRPLLLFGILLIFTGVQLVTLGLLAEMQARTYHESQNKPVYVIKEARAAHAGRPRRSTRTSPTSRKSSARAARSDSATPTWSSARRAGGRSSATSWLCCCRRGSPGRSGSSCDRRSTRSSSATWGGERPSAPTSSCAIRGKSVSATTS
jgi:glycosyltransferase involved in cell wall biosynthesis